MRPIIATLLILLCGLPLTAAGPDAAELSTLARKQALQHLPTPLYRNDKQWDKTKEVKVLRVRNGKPTTKYVEKNDGLWRRAKVEALNPADSFQLVIGDLKTVDGTTTFTVNIAADVRVEAEQQQWESGLKLYGTGVRARARAKATLHCEVTSKTEFKNGLPEFVFTLKVLDAKTSYEDLKVEHVVGLGGEAAKVIGNSAIALVHQWKPSLERDLLEKANKAAVKAGQDKEFRISLAKMIKK